VSWYNPFTWSVVTGVDLDAEARRTRELKEWEARLDADAANQGRYAEDWWQTHYDNLAKEGQILDPLTYTAQVTDAAKEGALEGLEKTQGAVKDTLSSATAFTLKGVLGFVPWWVWLGGIAYLAWRFGLLKKIKLPFPT